MSVVLRQRLEDDFDALSVLAASVHERDGYPPYLPGNDIGHFLRSGDPIDAWIGVDGDRVVGHVALHRSSSPPVMNMAASALARQPEELAVVARLLVAPDHRRSGLARRLMSMAANAAVALGRVPILDVVDRFGPAIKLYESIGWTRLGTTDVLIDGVAPLREHVYAAPQTADRRD